MDENLGKETLASSPKKGFFTTKKFHFRRKKLNAYDLFSLSEFLPELNDSLEVTPAAKFKLILKEGKHLSALVNHPAFQAKLLGAIYRHIMSTQLVEDEEPNERNKCGSEKRNQKKYKAQSRKQ
ncbi:hypothetical protein D8674_003862 [Pyrus ussuriensis x Pyrus communis]|uniref:Uncharacterized protein n=1 Tax=Pyrus ussuriensis x Pyrus communis TaxID=2448454 RepID=A0A5N5FIU5_9ROSA|nr:hypothetical protein D8674_003862 [Pyrus ussuriensis x Pyrus communis]